MNESPEDLKKKVREQFGRTASEYVKSEWHARGPDLADMVSWLSPDRSWICLDIATGGGHVARNLAGQVSTVVATDLTMEMLEAARSSHMESGLHNIVYVLADAENLPFPDKSFDVVTCRIAPHHFTDKAKFVSEASRVLKDDGKFLLVDNVVQDDPELAEFMNTFEWMRDNSHIGCASIAEWETMFQESGLEITTSSSRKKKYEFPSWVKRTTETQEQRDKVERFILSASEKNKKYFNVEVKDGRLQSLEIDEWMAMAERKAH